MFEVVCISGSMKLYPHMIKLAEKLTHEGYIVLMPFVAIPHTEQVTSELKKQLDTMHMQKIDMSSHVYVVTQCGYIGESTRNEIAYTLDHNKEVIYVSID